MGQPAASVLIGRHAELAVLDALIAQTTAGAGGVVLLAGDPGVGKTRLAREATERTYWLPGGQEDSRRASSAAVELAERAGDTEALGAALIARQFTLRGPDFLDDRLSAGLAVLDIDTRLGNQDQAGALGLVRADVEQMAAIAEASRNPLQRWWVLIYRGLPAADAYRIGQLGRIYWTQGRLAELEDDIIEALVRFPGLVTLRCIRALADAAAGRAAGATAEVNALVADGFAALPRNSLYLAILAEAVVTCRATELARPILDELAPYAPRNLIQGVPVGWGAAAWHIARLEWLLGRRGDAARSAATARRLHRQWGAGGLGDPLAALGQAITTAPLGRRESEVLNLLASGQANAEIAVTLGVSVHTIERHVANIFGKIGVRNVRPRRRRLHPGPANRRRGLGFLPGQRHRAVARDPPGQGRGAQLLQGAGRDAAGHRVHPAVVHVERDRRHGRDALRRDRSGHREVHGDGPARTEEAAPKPAPAPAAAAGLASQHRPVARRSR